MARSQTALAISLILALSVAGVFAYLYFSSSGGDGGSGGSGGGSKGSSGGGGSPPAVSGAVNAAWAFICDPGGSDFPQLTALASQFDLVALASVLPQDWDNDDPEGNAPTAFQHAIYETDNYLNTSTKPLAQYAPLYGYLFSIGGSNANTWSAITDDPDATAQTIIKYCEDYGFTGVDFDIEQIDVDGDTFQAAIDSIAQTVRSAGYFVQHTVQLGLPQYFNTLLTNNNYDWVAPMLYSNGMYTANGDGGGCGWQDWATMCLSKCADASCNCDQASCWTGIDTSKILLAYICDVQNGNDDDPATADDVNTMLSLLSQYNGGGLYLWVIPGWFQTTLPPPYDTVSGCSPGTPFSTACTDTINTILPIIKASFNED